MTKVTVNPGVCGFITKVEASAVNRGDVTLKVATGCEAINKMMNTLGDTFNAYELCLVKPGKGPLFGFASEHFPVHAACPVIAGITKCAEAECKLALPRNSEIIFEKD